MVDFKEKIRQVKEKVESAWFAGTIQKNSRMTYDIFWNVILFFLIIGTISIFFAGGIGAGYFASLVKDEDIRSYLEMEDDIYNYEETSKMYFDEDVYIGNIRSDLHREETSLDQISETLINAVIATEDEYFLEHNGVVPKAIIRAVVQEATNANMKTGGSTLTQQLIKNQMLTNEVSFDRKAKEILLALRLENFFEKDQILEAYLNIIPYGREASGNNIAGIQTATQGIFGVNANEVNLPQAAFLAGLPQSPSAYTPFINQGGIKDADGLKPGINRMKSVLKRMVDSKYISEAEYEEALTYDIVADFVDVTDSTIKQYSYLTDEIQERAKVHLKKILIEEDGYTIEDLENDEELDEQYNDLADRDLRMNGYNIHSTINKEIYDGFQEVAKNYTNYGPDRTTSHTDPETGARVENIDPVQTGGILIENHTGKIIGFVGGREYNINNQYNHATAAKRPTGSTIKPLLYAAAMEKGVVQPGSIIADVPWAFRGWTPKNYGGGHYGLVSAREALAKSHNIPAARTYSKIINDNPAEEYLEKMGITSLTAADKENPSLSLGGMADGITVEENTNAFTTFSNDGQFVDAYMIDKITTSNGDIIYEHEAEPVDVFSPQTAYLMIDMMRGVINSGTGTYVNSQLKYRNVDWAGKTGTSNDYKDAWFVATNPNVTFGTWIGYNSNKGLDYCPGCSLSYSQRNIKLWAELINSASTIKPELMVPQTKFQRPEGIVQRSYCATSGLLPSQLCEQAGLVESDIFNAKFVPTKVDDSLTAGGSYVVVNGKSVVAGPNTPSEFIVGGGSSLSFNPEFLKRNGYNKLNSITQLYPRKNRQLWERIGTSGSSGASDVITNDGASPSAPTSLNMSNNALTWARSSSTDVVGYRIYQAASKGGSFKLIGSSTSTSLSTSGGTAAYYVKAVDYFGLESAASSELFIGEPVKPIEPTEDQVEEPPKEETIPKEDEAQDTDTNEQPNKDNNEDKDKDKVTDEDQNKDSDEEKNDTENND